MEDVNVVSTIARGVFLSVNSSSSRDRPFLGIEECLSFVGRRLEGLVLLTTLQTMVTRVLKVCIPSRQ